MSPLRALLAKPRPRRLTRRRLLAAYALLLVPAVVGAVLGAPLLLTVAAIGLADLGATRVGVLIPPREYRTDVLKGVVPIAAGIVLVIIAGKHVPEQCLGRSSRAGS
jgi:putative Mn2+ efflux pump MntP